MSDAYDPLQSNSLVPSRSGAEVDYPAPRDAIQLPSCGPRPAWMDEARCASENLSPIDFFLEGIYQKGSKPYVKARDRAKAICDLCDVREECLDYAIENGIRNGIWGGMTASERRLIRYPKRLTMPDGGVYVYPRPVAS